LNGKNLKIDDPSHTFVIAEAGSNWKVNSYEEDITRAKKMIEKAAESGADAVKFQTYKPETTYAYDGGTSNYLKKQGIETNINELFEHLSMPYEMIKELSEFSISKNIMFMSSPFSIRDAEEVNPYVEIHKLASFEINHLRLLEYLIKSKKLLLISTGASTFNEIDFAINLVKKKGDLKNVGLMQCTSCYPSPINALNLSVIPKLKERYQVPVGFSDHSVEPLIAPLLAIGYGATFIEKHFTLDRSFSGPDHPFALEPKELKLMVKSIRDADRAKGNGEKIVLEEEEELRKFATRSLQTIKDVKKGDIFEEGNNFEVLRPGNRKRGLDVRYLEQVIGKKAKQDIQNGDGIIDYE
jgi:N,N'-diacetyllegionaminate synthase